MSTTTPCRRRDQRMSLHTGADAAVEFVHPGPNGPRHVLTLLDLSVSGLSFAFDEELSGIDPGATIPDVTLRIGNATARGELLVMHVSPSQEGKSVCGALFYPASDSDLRSLHDLLAGIGLNQAG